jgi:hypothetical protein
VHEFGAEVRRAQAEQLDNKHNISLLHAI